MLNIASGILHPLYNTVTLEKRYCAKLGIHVEVNAEHIGIGSCNTWQDGTQDARVKGFNILYPVVRDPLVLSDNEDEDPAPHSAAIKFHNIT